MLVTLLRERLRPHRRLLLGVVALQAVANVVMLYLPSLNARIIDEGVITGRTGVVWRLGGLMLAVSLVQIVCSVGAAWFGSRTATSFGRDLRGALFARVGTFSRAEVQRFGAPSLITRTTNDVQQVQQLVVMATLIAVSAPILMVGGIVMALREDAGLGWILLVAVPVLIGAVGFVVSRMVPSFRLMQVRIDEVNRVLREQITGIRVVRAFVRERHETDRFAGTNRQLTDVAVRAGRWSATMFPIAMVVVNVSSVAVIWFGGHRIASGDMQIGALTAFLAYLLQILMSVMMATFMLMQLPRSAVSADRIGEVLATESSVRPPAEPLLPDLSRRGELELDAVRYAYPGAEQPVLDGVSLSAGPGRTVAVIGATGSGKSTLVNLVPRLFDVTAGAVRIAGRDVRDLAPDVLGEQLGLVPQQAHLFSGSVRSNLRWGKADATDEELWEALRIAQADDFVRALPEGLDAPVTQGGTNFSGGQRQRLAIARAVVRRPSIYLFDDAFSALDVGTDARLRAALAAVTTEATVLVVAQRVSTIRDADEIVVLDAGRVVGRGTHERLLTSCETYAEIVRSQHTQQEAAA